MESVKHGSFLVVFPGFTGCQIIESLQEKKKITSEELKTSVKCDEVNATGNRVMLISQLSTDVVSVTFGPD